MSPLCRVVFLVSLLALGACGAGTLSPATLAHVTTNADTSGGAVGALGSGGQGAGPSSGGTDSSAPSSNHGAAAGSGATATPLASGAGTGLLFGVLPDYDNAATNGLAGFIARTSTTPGANSGYVNVGPNGSIETEVALHTIDATAAAGVPVVSLSMTAKQSGKLTSAQLAGVQATIAEAQQQNIVLWLRYGYEMNFGGGDGQYANINEHNDPSDFKAQWAQVAALANPHRADAVPVKMFWSPNINSGGDLPYADWLPTDPNTIDVVGVDWYHRPGDALDADTLVAATQDIYAVAEAHQLPFLLGETAVIAKGTGADEAAEKLRWLAALTSASLRQQLPLYQGFFWFDYEKGGTNFALSQDTAVVANFSAWYATVFGTGGTSNADRMPAAGGVPGTKTAATGAGSTDASRHVPAAAAATN